MYHSDPDWLTTPEAAKRLRCSRMMVYRYIAAGLLIVAPRDKQGLYSIDPRSVDKLAHVLRQAR